MAIILITTWDNATVEIVRWILEQRGHKIITASNRADMKMALTALPDLVISTSVFPGGIRSRVKAGDNSHEETQNAAQEWGDYNLLSLLNEVALIQKPVLLLTGGRFQVKDLVDKHPRFEILDKPFTADALIKVVNNLLPQDEPVAITKKPNRFLQLTRPVFNVGFSLFIPLLLLLTGVAVGFLFLKGAIWASIHVLPKLILMGLVAFAIDLFILLPLSAIKSTRSTCALLIVLSSFIFGAITWFVGFIHTYSLWGIVAVVIGFFMMGIGVVPLALLATLFKGMWAEFFWIIFLIALTFGSRMFGLWLGSSTEK